MEAISVDLRQRICEACDDGLETRLETAERFGVSRSFVQKLLRRRSDFLSITPLPRHGGPAAKMSAAHRTLLRRLASGHGDATLAELCVELSNAGVAPIPIEKNVVRYKV